ncbi:hypothetical protein HZS_6468 [Henneguya salminicola]|nr:hypothetical protein HZS_6468 [Henneguya salminicola]
MRVRFEFTMEDHKKFVSRTVRAVLCLDLKKSVIRKSGYLYSLISELKKLAFGSNASVKFDVIFDEAVVLLKRIFGYELKSASNETFSINIINSNKKDVYYLINSVKNPISMENEKFDEILLVIVLSIIYMKEGVCDEGLNYFEIIKVCLWAALEELDIKRKSDENFVHPEHYINSIFIKQHYIERKKCGDMDNQLWEYIWGQRAKEEIDPNKIIKFVSDV